MLDLLEIIDEELIRQDIIEWILQNGIRNEKGEPLEFEQHGFLVQPYLDFSRKLVCRKCAQIGFSTMAILKEFYLARYRNYNCIHTLPTDEDVRLFAASKVNPIVNNNPVLRAIVQEVDTIYNKQVGNAFIFWQGTKGQSKGIMISSDVNIHDERDRSDQAKLETYRSRFEHSLYKAEWNFSNPSRPNCGVDVYWHRSDQKQWHIKCSRCGERQPLDYFVNVCKERRAYICRKCKEVLRPEDRLAGEWVETFPGRDWSGYQINQLMAPWITAAELIEGEETETEEFFYNFRLGLPVIGGANQVSRSIILQCCTEQVPAEGRWKLLGVDVGAKLHCVQGTENGITRAFTLPDWDSLHAYFIAQGINLAVVDNAPDTEEAAKFCRHFRSRAYRCIYDYDNEREEMIEWSDIEQTKEIRRDKEGVVWAHRTRIIDHTIDAYDKGEIYVYIKPNDPQLVGLGKPGVTEECLCGHWETLYVAGKDGQKTNIVKVDKFGNVIRTWESSGPDHFAHANVYFEIARQRKRPTTRMQEYRPKKPRVIRPGSKITGY